MGYQRDLTGAWRVILLPNGKVERMPQKHKQQQRQVRHCNGYGISMG